MKSLASLWHDEQGVIIAAEIVLIASILIIGVTVGLAALRDSIVTELADMAQALANINQSFSFSGVSGHHAFTGGGAFHDNADFCDRPNLSDGGNSKCIRICTGGGPVAECDGAPGSGGYGHGHHHGGGW